MGFSSGSSAQAVLLLLLLLWLTARELRVCRSDSQVGCPDADREALLSFKAGLRDPENRLSSWRGGDCCRWSGVACDVRTGAVTGIRLFDGSTPSNSSGSWNLSGKLSPALIRLKSLEHLDLSLSNFQNTPIPEFIGSMSRMRYLNLSRSGFAGSIPPQLGNLSSLQYLDLSSGFDPLAVDRFEWVSGLSSLKHLAMDGVDLSTAGSGWMQVINKLPSLVELHLSGCALPSIPHQLLPSPNLTSLAVIDLSSNNLNSTIPNWVANLTSLMYADFSSCSLHGPIPMELSELPHLSYLSLALNNNLTADCSKLLDGRWENIEIFDLSSNRLYGNLPASTGNITTLKELHLFDNNVEGGVPSSIGKLCNLKFLDLAGNNLSLPLPESLETSNICASRRPLPNLEYLRLSNNEIPGLLPEWVGDLPKLKELSLGYNSIGGPIPASLGRLSLLTDMGLQGNALNGSVPSTIGQLQRLNILDISSNNLSGNISEAHFSKLRELKILLMSYNSLVVSVSSTWVPPFQVRRLEMGSCHLGPRFPPWLRTQKALKYLDFSNASISDRIPPWFWDLSSNLSLLNMSFNRITGQLQSPMNIESFADIDLSSNLLSGRLPLPSNDVALLDLSNNRFSGPIPQNIGKLLPSLVFLLLSDNHIVGSIPTSIGQMQYLQVLRLSRNNLTGGIPLSLQECSLLKALDLEFNNLSGTIPPTLGGLKQLQTLHLANNKLVGGIPAFLRNCSSLETLDLGHNRLSGGIPAWIGCSLPVLRILRLRSNRFSEPIPPELSNVSSLQVLDLAQNNLGGPVPRSFGNLRSMVASRTMNRYLLYGWYRGRYYGESLLVHTKRQQLQYTKTLSLVTSIDLSGNKLTGDFPEQLLRLSGLIVLDLSGNNMSGTIPEQIAGMRSLSSLDLSSNSFSGIIPPGLTALTFISYLNLSNNNFSGRIPAGGQLGTMASAFDGNPYLCGAPLPESCPEVDVPEKTPTQGNRESADAGDDDKWFYLTVASGFAAGLLGPFAVLSVKRSWAAAYFTVVDWVADNIADAKDAILVPKPAARRRRAARGRNRRRT
ncbi:hypothetical protein Taro_053979 [Colocasia esculenta]|uniref:Leucine-rich repeat-containing N-terminal plant-type domain-containing protein n=1 Tax=Colocasia esculenta TaxID=4460 RepID=A0A843XMP4_COLES|nr:hypothetical protein [Colocasia esculenta]